MDADTQGYSVLVRRIGVRVSGLVAFGVSVVPQLPAQQPAVLPVALAARRGQIVGKPGESDAVILKWFGRDGRHPA